MLEEGNGARTGPLVTASQPSQPPACTMPSTVRVERRRLSLASQLGASRHQLTPVSCTYSVLPAYYLPAEYLPRPHSTLQSITPRERTTLEPSRLYHSDQHQPRPLTSHISNCFLLPIFPPQHLPNPSDPKQRSPYKQAGCVRRYHPNNLHFPLPPNLPYRLLSLEI